MIPNNIRLSQENILIGLFVGTLWIGLWLAGYPQPNVDDAFFSGAAVSLVNTGVLANPWIEGFYGWVKGAEPNRYFLQPPFHPYVLSAWLKIFGISTASMTGFACFCGAFSCYIAALWTRKFNTGKVTLCLTILLVTGWALQRGLRPDFLGFPLALAGLWFIKSETKTWKLALGGFLCSCAVLCHPFTMCLIVPSVLLQLLRSFQCGHAAELFRALLGLSFGITLSACLFILAIGGQVLDFINDFTQHAHFVTKSEEHALYAFLDQMLLGQEGWHRLLVLFFALTVWIITLWRIPASRGLFFTFAAVGTLMTLLGLCLYARFSVAYWFAGIAWVSLIASRWNYGMGKAFCMIAPAILVSWQCAGHLAQALVNHQINDADSVENVRSWVNRSNSEMLLFDACTLRHIFDYNPPPMAKDFLWSYSPGRSIRFYSPNRLEPLDLWVVNPAWSLRRFPEEASRGNLVLAGKKFHSIQSTKIFTVVAGGSIVIPVPASFHWRRSDPESEP